MSGKTVLQLGYGMQGKASLADLLGNRGIGRVIVTDVSEEVKELPRRLNDPRVEAKRLDAGDEEAVLALMKEADVVVELLPGMYTLRTAKLAVRAGVSLVTSMYLFNPGEQDPVKRQAQLDEIEALGEAARAKEITILEEFGMDPGLDLIVGSRALRELDEVKAYYSYGAGFPEPDAANNPLRYRFTWSVIGVMRSYLRPAKIYRDGKVVEIPADAMFAPENTHHLKLDAFGEPLECFANGNSTTYAKLFGLEESIHSMGRYICRWPGTGAFWQVMARSGFLSGEPISVAGASVAPDAFCAALLGAQKQFEYEDDQRDVGLIRADVRGYKNGKPLRAVYQIVDYRDLKSGLTAMQRTVGFPMSIGAQMILDRRVTKTGIMSPVEIPFEPFMEEIQRRGVEYDSWVEAWDGSYSY